MSISGPLGPRSLAAYGLAPSARPPAARPAAAPAPAPAPGAADPAMPAGSDPQLWSVLTSEERSFFLRQQQLGAVTYGPGARAGSQQVADAPRGLRIDVTA